MLANLLPSRHLLVQINNENTKAMCEICFKLTKTYQNDVIDAILVYCILRIVLVFLLLALNKEILTK